MSDAMTTNTPADAVEPTGPAAMGEVAQLISDLERAAAACWRQRESAIRMNGAPAVMGEGWQLESAAKLHERAAAVLRRTPEPTAVSEAADDTDEVYELGKRDGYENAIQELDLATGGDGEFKGSTFPGETVDVPVMKARIIERFTPQPLEAPMSEPQLDGWKLVPVEPTREMLHAGFQEMNTPGNLPQADDVFAAMLAASPQPPALPESAETVVAIKPLEWKQHTEGVWRAETIVGDYRVWTHHEAKGTWFWQLSYHGRISDGSGTEQECLLAAQADYETRIRSALYAAPSSEQARIEQLERERDIAHEELAHRDAEGWEKLIARAEAAEATVAELRKDQETRVQALQRLMPYLVWQLGPESPGCHPTMESVVADVMEQFGLGGSFKRKLDHARAALTKETANG